MMEFNAAVYEPFNPTLPPNITERNYVSKELYFLTCTVNCAYIFKRN